MSLNHLLLKAQETDQNNPNFTVLKDLLKDEHDERMLATTILSLQDDATIKNFPNKELQRVLRVLTALAKAQLQHSYYDAILILESISPSPAPCEPHTETVPQLELEVSTQERKSLFRSVWSYFGNDFENNFKHFVEEAKQYLKNKLAEMSGELQTKNKNLQVQSMLLNNSMQELVEMQLDSEKLRITNVFLTKELANTQAQENHEIMLLTNQLHHTQETLHVAQDHNRDYAQKVKTLELELNTILKTQNEQLKTQLKKLQTPGRNSLLAHKPSGLIETPPNKTTLKLN